MIHASECQILLNRLLSKITSSSLTSLQDLHPHHNSINENDQKHHEQQELVYHEQQQRETLLLEQLLHEIQAVIETVPLSTHLLSKILARHFPHKQRSLDLQKRYTFILLSLVNLFPHLQPVIFDLIIERCLAVDHDIQWDLECLTDDANDSDDDQERGDDDDSDSNISVVHSDNFEKSLKCDEFIHSFLNYVHSVADMDDPSTIEPIFSNLVMTFEKTLLHTHKSKYTQFILFVVASYHPSFPDALLGVLFQNTLNQQVPHAVRLTAISYIASYCARANYLDQHTITTTLSLLHSFAQSFVQSTPQPKSLASLKAIISTRTKPFAIFYNTIQAILYIFCFRYKELLADPDSRITTGSFPSCLSNLKAILTSSLHPLLFVSPSIASEFARICHYVEIMYAFPLFQTVKFGWDDIQMCDSYFPFDPIPDDWRCQSFIQELFVNWNDESIDEDHVEDDYDEEHMFVGCSGSGNLDHENGVMDDMDEDMSSELIAY